MTERILTKARFRLQRQILVIFAALTWMLPCYGASLVSNVFDPDNNSSHLTGYFSYFELAGDESRVADDFTIAHAGLVQSVEWYGYFPGFSSIDTADFLVTIYDNAATNLPSAEVEVFVLSNVIGTDTG